VQLLELLGQSLAARARDGSLHLRPIGTCFGSIPIGSVIGSDYQRFCSVRFWTAQCHTDVGAVVHNRVYASVRLSVHTTVRSSFLWTRLRSRSPGRLRPAWLFVIALLRHCQDECERSISKSTANDDEAPIKRSARGPRNRGGGRRS